MLEDPAFEGAQLGGRLEAELVECRARVAVRGEGVGLAARAVERDDALRLKVLPMRVRCDEGVELRRPGSRARPAARSSIDSRLERPPGDARRAVRRRPGRRARRRGRRAPGRARARVRRAARGAATSRSNRSASSSPSSTRTRYPGGRVWIRSAPSALRSAWTCTWSAFWALAGGDSPQIPSISRSVETTAFGCRSSWASNARGLRPPSVTGAPSSSSTSNGPNKRNSNA